MGRPHLWLVASVPPACCAVKPQLREGEAAANFEVPRLLPFHLEWTIPGFDSYSVTDSLLLNWACQCMHGMQYSVVFGSTKEMYVRSEFYMPPLRFLGIDVHEN